MEGLGGRSRALTCTLGDSKGWAKVRSAVAAEVALQLPAGLPREIVLLRSLILFT